MSTLSEIEARIDTLTIADKEKLLLILAAQLREQRKQLPEPRSLSKEQLQGWIDQDEVDLMGI